MEILETNSNIIKNKFNRDLIYSKKYLKPKKMINTIGDFQCINNID